MSQRLITAMEKAWKQFKGTPKPWEVSSEDDHRKHISTLLKICQEVKVEFKEPTIHVKGLADFEACRISQTNFYMKPEIILTGSKTLDSYVKSTGNNDGEHKFLEIKFSSWVQSESSLTITPSNTIRFKCFPKISGPLFGFTATESYGIYGHHLDLLHSIFMEEAGANWRSVCSEVESYMNGLMDNSDEALAKFKSEWSGSKRRVTVRDTLAKCLVNNDLLSVDPKVIKAILGLNKESLSEIIKFARGRDYSLLDEDDIKEAQKIALIQSVNQT